MILKRVEDLSISNANPKDIFFVLVSDKSSAVYRMKAKSPHNIQEWTGYAWKTEDQIRRDSEIVIIENFPPK